MWLSLARIYPAKHRSRQVSFALASFYTLYFIVATLFSAYGCPNSAGGTRQRLEKCYSMESGKRTRYQDITLSIAIRESSIYGERFSSVNNLSLLVDLVMDTLLVIVPAYLLSDVALVRGEKLLIIFLGSGSIFTLLSLALTSFIVYGPLVSGSDKNDFVLGTTHLAVSTFSY